MELEMLRNCKDRETQKEYEKGKKYKFNEKRCKEILNSPYNVAKLVKKEDEKNVQTKTNKEPQNKM